MSVRHGRTPGYLLIDIDAQRLAALGADGGISGQIELAGTPAQPMLNARLQADTLGVPARFSARGLKLNAQLAEGDDAPLQLDLRVQQLSTSGHSGSRGRGKRSHRRRPRCDAGIRPGCW